MNKKVGALGALTVSVTVVLFAALMLFSQFWSYFVCMLLPIGYIMMISGFYSESREKDRAASIVGMIFAAIYACLIFIVYFAETTTLNNNQLSEDVLKFLDFSRGGLLFNYDLLGYGMLALSTFFTGLAFKSEKLADKWLKILLLFHGLFFFGCFIMPMTGVFNSMSDGGNSIGGIIALECWCAYFLPVGILSFIHFKRK